MSDTLEPPAKRARFDGPDADIPGSPVDDMDDDIYDTTPVNPAPLPVKDEGLSRSSSAAAPTSTGLPSLQLPGLGLLSDPLKQESSVGQVQMNDEELEDGELSDSEDLYNDAKPAAATAAPQEENASSSEAPIVYATGAAHDGDVAPPPDAPTHGLKVDDATAVTIPEVHIEDKPEVAENAEADFLRAGDANKENAGAEWQLDSEDSGSSSDSSSDDSNDSSDDEGDSEDGELLDPEEQVRRLLMEAVNEAGTSGSGKVATVNEVAEEFQKPDITVTETTKVTELGKVETVVDNIVVIKAKTAGDFQVLEPGSALCLENRTVIGKVVETLGRVQEPRYSVGFSDRTEIGTLGITTGTVVYYVDEHSKFILTEALRTQKFTDASNLYDEEANEVEFSDDEKEAEHKRKQKDMKKAKAEANRPPEDPKPHVYTSDKPPASAPGQYQGGGLNYGSDDDDDFGMYKPLARPVHFEDIVGAGAPIEDRSHVRRGNMRGRGGWPDRGRAFRGRGGGGGGGGGGRGNQRGRFPGPLERGGRHQENRPAGPSERGGRHQEHRPAGPSERGGRHQEHRPAGPPERGGRHQDHPRGRHPSRKEGRSASSASPHRQNQGRPPPQRSPGRGNKSGRRQHRHASSPALPPPPPPPPPSLPPASASANAYAQNSMHSASAWSMPPASYAPQAPHAYAPPAQPAIPAGSYVNPAFYGQPGAPQDQQQQNLAQWAQWFQLAAAMSQSQSQPQPNPAPSANPPQGSTQNSTPNLQDILRTLGGGSQNR